MQPPQTAERTRRYSNYYCCFIGRGNFLSAAALKIISGGLYPISEAVQLPALVFRGRKFLVRCAGREPFANAIPAFAGASLLAIFYLRGFAPGRDTR
jgi:hypothetical protein